MECKVSVFLLNDDFSQEHADQHYGGKESELNRKYEWEDELKITTRTDKIEVIEEQSFPLRGNLPNGEEFSYDLKNMRLFELQGEVTTHVGCSESILSSYEIVESEDVLNLKIYLKDYEPMANPIPGLYIASQEFPSELEKYMS